MAAFMGTLAGALFIALILSRIALHLTRRWRAGYLGLLSVYIPLAVVVGFVAALGAADGGPLNFAFALTFHVPALLFWLTVDLIREYRGRALSPAKRAATKVGG